MHPSDRARRTVPRDVDLGDMRLEALGCELLFGERPGESPAFVVEGRETDDPHPGNGAFLEPHGPQD